MLFIKPLVYLFDNKIIKIINTTNKTDIIRIYRRSNTN